MPLSPEGYAFTKTYEAAQARHTAETKPIVLWQNQPNIDLNLLSYNLSDKQLFFQAFPREVFERPLIEDDFADIFMLWDEAHGEYVAFGTRSHRFPGEGPERKIQRMFSDGRDITKWSEREEALDVESIPEEYRENLEWWAPEVRHNERVNRYQMYVSHFNPKTSTSSIHLFEADSLKDNFTYSNLVVEGEDFGTIDASAFTDPRTGKDYLLRGSGWRDIIGAELTPDGKYLVPGTESICLSPTDEKKSSDELDPITGNPLLDEAPHLIYVDAQGQYVRPGQRVSPDDQGRYVLFVSKGNTWEEGAYAVIAAESETPLGSYQRMAEVLGTSSSEVLSPGKYNRKSVGHNAVTVAANNEVITPYHDLNPEGRYNPNDEHKRKYRYPYIAPLTIDEKGWPNTDLPEPGSERLLINFY